MRSTDNIFIQFIILIQLNKQFNLKLSIVLGSMSYKQQLIKVKM
jgi:hypothetical protein